MTAIYLDHAATTPLCPEARAAMLKALDACGNPSSLHEPGRRAHARLERARAQVAAFAGARPDDVVFTSGGTEADALAVLGLARAAAAAGRGRHVVVGATEHAAVRGGAARLASEGFTVTTLPVDGQGRIDPDDVGRALRAGTVLVSVAAANNETGTLAPLAEIADRCRARGVPLHTDAVHAAGRIPLDAGSADLMSLSAHKLYGPTGAGALIARRDLALEPLAHGGHQERGRRPGTEAVAAIAGFGAACDVARRRAAGIADHLAAVGLRLERGLLALGARLHGAPEARVPGTIHVGWAGLEGELIAINLDLEGVAVSTGAACASGTPEPSAVLLAMGLTPERAREAVRFSAGRSTTYADVDRVLALLPPILDRVRRGA